MANQHTIAKPNNKLVSVKPKLKRDQSFEDKIRENDNVRLKNDQFLLIMITNYQDKANLCCESS